MRNHVVEIIQEVFAGKGKTTLRFNFRGVGRSQRRYDEGVGEQEDVHAAVRYLRELKNPDSLMDNLRLSIKFNTFSKG